MVTPVKDETAELCDCEWEGEQTARKCSSFLLARARDRSHTTSRGVEDGAVERVEKKGGSDWRWGRGGGVRYVTGRRLGRRFVAIVASVTASGCSGPQCDID